MCFKDTIGVKRISGHRPFESVPTFRNKKLISQISQMTSVVLRYLFCWEDVIIFLYSFSLKETQSRDLIKSMETEYKISALLR